MTQLPALPARAADALTEIGITDLEGVVVCRADGLTHLRGIDAEVIEILDNALTDQGWSFALSSRP
jgi:hypothetical protein